MMYEFLEILKPTYCDDCDMAYEVCDTTTEYCKKDMINAYERGREDAIDEFVKAIEKHQTRQDSYLDPPYVEMGLDMTDVLEVAKQLKEKDNE